MCYESAHGTPAQLCEQYAEWAKQYAARAARTLGVTDLNEAEAAGLRALNLVANSYNGSAAFRAMARPAIWRNVRNECTHTNSAAQKRRKKHLKIGSKEFEQSQNIRRGDDAGFLELLDSVRDETNRRIVEMHFRFNTTLEDIAGIIDLDISNVSRRLQVALAEIRTDLERR